MKKALFITTRNVLTTSGELRLIKNRALALSNFFGVETDFLVIRFKKNLSTYEEGVLNILKVYWITIFGMLGLYIRLRKDIKKLLENDEYTTIILSGIGTLHLVRYLKKIKYKGKITLDVHGSNKDILEHSRNKNFFKKLLLRFIYIFEEIYYKRKLVYVDNFLVVSSALQNLLINRYKIAHNSLFFVVPCAIDLETVDTSLITKNRKQSRLKYGVNDNDILFVYSGGVSSWQCIKETVDIFYQIKRNLTFPIKMIMLSHNISKLKEIAGNYDDIIYDSLNHSEVFEVLCSADYAFLIRDNIETNHVAFPNKFLEYISAGLKVITTPHLHDISKIVAQEQLGYIVDHRNINIELLIAYVLNTYRNNDLANHQKLLTETSFKNTLLEFSRFI